MDDADDPARTLLIEAERVAGIGSYLWELGTDPVVSDGFRALAGMGPDEVLSAEGYFSRVHPDDVLRVASAWNEAMASGVFPPTEYRLTRPDGTRCYLRGSGERREIRGRTVFVGAIVDVTARVELERELAEVHKTRAIAALAAGVAHDLGNWLTVLRHQGEQLPEGDAIRLEMERTLAPCEALTRGLLALAHVRPSHSRLDEARARVRQALPILRRAIGPRVEVTLTTGDLPAWTLIDPTHLEGVLLNLAVNARDAMPAGGTLAVDVAVEGSEDGGTVVIRVTDTGVGIPPDHLPRVFEPYFTTKAGEGGTGLGLASVRGTIRQHDGDVTVASTVGTGTVFTIRLPRRRGPTVLVVDDVVEVRSVVCRTLNRAGIGTLEACDGEAALATLAGRSVDLVVTDYVMPRMDGKALLTELHARGGPPVLLITGYAPDPSVGPARGVVVLRKPFRPVELLDAVWKVLATASAAP